METHILGNGLKVMLENRSGRTVAVEVNVKTGSDNEEPRIAGISHFVEHTVFDGTKKRPTALKISNEIERLGGEFNAATSNERTFYYIKLPDKHLEIALDILSDMLFRPLFDTKSIEKEKSIILDEINMVNDQPRYYQWILFERSLFKKHPCKNPVYGNAAAIKALSRKDLVAYHSKFYMPNNMTLVISGNLHHKGLELVKKYFDGPKGKPVSKRVAVKEPLQTKKQVVTEKKNINQSYMVIGYKTVVRSDPASYTFDVIRAILGRGQSGKVFDEIRNKLALAYDVGVYHNPNVDFGFFAVYANTNKKNIDRIVKIILKQFRSLERLSDKELEEAKTFLEGEFLLTTEDNQKMADALVFWDMSGAGGSVDEYLKRIRSVTKKDVAAAAKKYLNDNYTLTIIEQDK
jgi:predicted Zn-dependent peptidase